ncbi:MAG: NAAT family transporter [Gammaproteobacteria bacterium]|nr:NAAT family transporter [Gammaproteobacteria bacterium]
MKLLYTTTVTLIMVMDPLGNVPLALSVLRQIKPKRRMAILLRESLFAFFILAVFLFWGGFILDGLSITQEALQVAGGMILFLIAIKMIFPPTDETRETVVTEPFLVPLAIPMIAGPSAIATVILFSTQYTEQMPTLFLALVIASVILMAVLLFANQLQRVLGEKGLIAVERLMGMLLTTIAVQMFMDGVHGYLCK